MKEDGGMGKYNISNTVILWVCYGFTLVYLLKEHGAKYK